MTSQTWRKSSYSGSEGNCVEVADAAAVVQVRDTTNRAGAVLSVSADAWKQFTETIKLARRGNGGHGRVLLVPA